MIANCNARWQQQYQLSDKFLPEKFVYLQVDHVLVHCCAYRGSICLGFFPFYWKVLERNQTTQDCDTQDNAVHSTLNVHSRSVSESACCFPPRETRCMWDIGCLRVWLEKPLTLKTFPQCSQLPTTHIDTLEHRHTHNLDTWILSTASSTEYVCYVCQSDHTTLQGVVWLASFCGKLVVML